MRKLISADFCRLRRDKAFWIGTLAMLVFTVALMLVGGQVALKDSSEFQYALDGDYFCYAIPIGLPIAVYVSLFLGTEYSDGTIRNKLVVGHTRRDIYLSHLFTNIVGGLSMLLASLLGGLVGIPFLGTWKMGKMVLVFLLISVLFIISYVAIFTLIGMLCSNKAISAVLTILLFLGLMCFAMYLYSRLSEPEMINGLIITQEGMQMGDPSPNPRYLTGIKREIYQFVIDFLPTGQCGQMRELNVLHPVRMMVSSIVIAIVTTLGGIFAFERKDLK